MFTHKIKMQNSSLDEDIKSVWGSQQVNHLEILGRQGSWLSELSLDKHNKIVKNN